MLSLLLLAIKTWENPIRGFLPDTVVLDDLTYKMITIGFPLLTLMLITGSIWANRAWGSYWSWDPKEDWALITWLVSCNLLACSYHPRLERQEIGLLLNRWLRRGDVHVPGRNLSPTWNARLRELAKHFALDVE